MEDFTKMVEAYRWRGGGSSEKKHLCASPALATPCNAEEEEAGSSTVRCTYKKDASSPNTSLLHIRKEPHNVGHDVHIQTNHVESKSCVSDDDGDVGSQGALSFSTGSYKPGQKHLLKKKPRASSCSRSSRQLVFSMEDMDAKSSLEGRVKSKVKIKKETKKKSRQTQTKQSGAKTPSKQGSIEVCNMPEIYDDSACEDGPIEFCLPEMAYSPGVVSQPSHFELANTPALKKRKRRSSTPSNQVGRHVLMNGKSPFFAHTKPTAKSTDVKKVKKALSNTLISKPESKTAAVKVYTRRREKASPVSSNEVGTIEIDENEESSGHLSGDQSADSAKEAVVCVNSGVLRSRATSKAKTSADSSEEAIVCLNSGVLPSKTTSKAKTSAYFTPKALGQRNIANKTWVPPISVHALIQEELYQDPWKVLVACMLLNKTAGAQMRKVIWDLFALCPSPEAAVAAETDKVEEVIRPLGLQKKRARMIQKFSKDYLGKEWLNVGELHGIGKYATDAYAIFCEGRWREVKPEDHMLVDYWQYLCVTDGLGYAFKDDREKGRVSQQAES